MKKSLAVISSVFLGNACVSMSAKSADPFQGAYISPCVPQEEVNSTEQDIFGPQHFTHISSNFDKSDSNCSNPLSWHFTQESRGSLEKVAPNEYLMTLPPSEDNFLRSDFPEVVRQGIKDRARQIPVLSDAEEKAASDSGVIPLPPADACLRRVRVDNETISYALEAESQSLCFAKREDALAATSWTSPFRRMKEDEVARAEDRIARADTAYKKQMNMIPTQAWVSDKHIAGLFQSDCYPYGSTSARDRHAFGKTTVDVLYQYADKNCEVLLQALSSEGPAPKIHQKGKELVLEVPPPRRGFINLSLRAREALLNNPEWMPRLPQDERKDLTDFGVTRIRMQDQKSCFFRISVEEQQIKQWIGEREKDCARSVDEALTQTERYDVLHRLNDREADSLYDKVAQMQLIYENYKESTKAQ